MSYLVRLLKGIKPGLLSILSGPQHTWSWLPNSSVKITRMSSSLPINRLTELLSQPVQDISLEAYIIPEHDVHLSEYLAPCDKRLEYVTQFTGSAGTAIVCQKGVNLLWTDGRYFVQADAQLDKNWTLMKNDMPGVPNEHEWMTKNLNKGSIVGGDAKLFPYNEWLTLKNELEKCNIYLIHINENLVDKVWIDKPPLPRNPIKALPFKYTGKTAGKKIQEVKEAIEEKNVDMYICTALDEIAWLLNLRGSDIDYNPLFFSFCVLMKNKLHLFVDEGKFHPGAREQLESEGAKITFHPYGDFFDFVIKQAQNDSVKKVWVDSNISYFIYENIPKHKLFCKLSPISLMKAIKNETEAAGMKNAHVKDGTALCRYFHWLEKELQSGAKMTEISVAEKLESFRKDEEDYVGRSFPTISSSGPHGAIVHYIPDSNSNRAVVVDEIYLCDSGAQFLDGTTDVTRTVHIGTPTQHEKECYTRVLKGLIALTSVVFPNKLKGNYLDATSRRFLWEIGLDYAHGTGHGIGSYLCVHEGPMGISWRPFPDDPGLQENMFVSNEPGYYEQGQFGIRIENIVQIVQASTPHNFQGKPYLTFSTITMCPVQTKMVVLGMLTDKEKAFLNDYHKEVRDTVGPILQKRGLTEAYEWLVKETAPLT